MNIESARTGTSAWTVISVALLLCPTFALAQSTGLAAPKPRCVYVGAMTDAQIEQCTGYPVYYNYALVPVRVTLLPVRSITP